MTGSSGHLGRPLLRQLNIAYSAFNVVASDIKDPERMPGCDFIKIDVCDEI